MKSSKTKYDPLIPWLYSIEQEGLLPKNFREKIGSSNISCGVRKIPSSILLI
jgi:hypothetical protein